MSETKKRPLSEDAEELRPKKRVVSDDHDTSRHINGVDSQVDEPRDDHNLEMFRKDAIYRRMKHYSREYERSEARVAELERRRNTCEAGLAALEACWTQIISTIRSLAKPEDLPPLDVNTDDLFDLTSHVSDDSDPEYVDALRNKMHATSELVGAFVRLGGQSSAILANDELHQSCQKTQTECSTLRSELSLMRSKLRHVELERNKYHEDLVAAEKRLDRLQSKTVSGLQSQSLKTEMKAESLPDTSASPAQIPPDANGTEPGDDDDWREIANLRYKQIGELHQQNAILRNDIMRLQLELRSPSEEVITHSLYYQQLDAACTQLQQTQADDQNEISKLKAEVEQLTAARQAVYEDVTGASDQAVQDLKTMLIKRDNENARLREQRDQQLAELNERKQKDHARLQSAHEYRTLAESRSERIKVLVSEISRLKTRLAANIGDEDLMSFLFHADADFSVQYVNDLRTRLAAADDRIKAFEICLSRLNQDHPDIQQHVNSEMEAREQLIRVQKQLEKYQAVYGEASSVLPPSTQDLSERLQSKESEIQKLRLQQTQHDQAESALYAELDKLSAAWETLDRQVKSKVFDLSMMEERVTKSGLDKAKSENKYYSAMRDKEAVETERKNLSRNLEKQAKNIERLVESEKILLARVRELENEASLYKAVSERQTLEFKNKETELAESKVRANAEHRRLREFNANLQAIHQTFNRREVEVRAKEEEVARLKKEAERYAQKMKLQLQNQSASSSTREAQLQSEVEKCMSILKCSTCKQNMRNTVITKCMHSFCKSCVDSRIATRQRKCPACNLPFSQGEVQSLFFQ